MPQLLVRRIEPTVVRQLRRRAVADGVSMEEAHRRVLRQALLGEHGASARNFIDYLRDMPADFEVKRSRDLPRSIDL